MASLELEVRGVLVSAYNSPNKADIIEEKTYKGKKVRALMVARIRSSACYTTPASKLAEVIDATVDALPADKKAKLRALFDRCYVRENLTWSDAKGVWGGVGTFYETFKTAWNKSKGDPNDCEKKLGVNDWGEAILPAKACVDAYNRALKLKPDDHGLVLIQDKFIKSRGRAKLDPKRIASSLAAELGL